MHFVGPRRSFQFETANDRHHLLAIGDSQTRGYGRDGDHFSWNPVSELDAAPQSAQNPGGGGGGIAEPAAGIEAGGTTPPVGDSGDRFGFKIATGAAAAGLGDDRATLASPTRGT